MPSFIAPINKTSKKNKSSLLNRSRALVPRSSTTQKLAPSPLSDFRETFTASVMSKQDDCCHGPSPISTAILNFSSGNL